MPLVRASFVPVQQCPTGRAVTMKRYIDVPPAGRRDSCQNVVTMRF